MIKKLFGILVLFVIFILVVSLIVYGRSLSGRIYGWGISLNLSGFELKNFSKDKTSFSSVDKLEALNDTVRVFIDRTKISDHKKYIDDRKFLLESLFLPTTSPYPEVITNIIECPNEFKPKEENVSNGVIYTIFAGERFNYGVCAKDLVKYNSKFGIFDCKEKGIFEIRIFSDGHNKIERIINSFKC